MRTNGFDRNNAGRHFGNYTEGVNKKATMLRLAKYVLKHYKFSCLIVMVCILITALTTLASTLFTRTLIDNYIVPLTKVDNPEFASLAQALFKLGIILFFGVICSYIFNRIMINVSQGTMLRLRKDMFSHMEELPISYFDSHSHGDIMSTYTNDIDTLRQVISQSLPQMFNSFITLVVTLTSMVVLSIPLSLVSILMAVVIAVTTTKLSKHSRGYFKAQQNNLAKVNGFIEEMMTGQKVVKVFRHEDKAIGQFEDINEDLRSSTYSANRIANIIMPINGNLGNLSYVLIAVVGSIIALTPHFSIGGATFTLSLGTLVSFLTLNKQFAQPVSQISQQINSIIVASAGAERIFNIMDEKPEEDNGTVTLVNIKRQDDGSVSEVNGRDNEWAWKTKEGNYVHVAGGVKFNMVDFSYTPEKQVLFDINIDAMPDQKIAFVGGTGAGKTTITNLINRFYEIQDGHILIDGIDVKDICKKDLRHSLGLVLQETKLFSGTVLDNIRYGRLDATDQECIEAAQLTGADNFIRRLSNGYNTRLNASGDNLSQGERQLLAIARAAVADTPILILDEATSSIDTHTEQMVQQGMDSLTKGRTTFVIAHRLSTVRNADCIIVLDHGKIIEKGNHETLIAAKGTYNQLYTGLMEIE